MEIIEVDIFQNQEMTGGTITEFIFVDIFQTQQPDVGDEDKTPRFTITLAPTANCSLRPG